MSRGGAGRSAGGASGGGGGAGTAATTTFTPAGGIAAGNVQAAIEELAGERAPRAVKTVTASGIVGSSIDLTAGFDTLVINLDAAAENLTLVFGSGGSKVLIEVVQNATGGFACSFASVDTWSHGLAPLIDTNANAVTALEVTTTDGGTTQRGWHGQRIVEYSFGVGGVAVVSTNGPGYRMRAKGKIVSIVSTCRTAGTVQATLVDINKNGAAVTTAGNRASIAAGATSSAVVTAIATPDVAAGDLLTCDVDQVGTNVIGLGVQVRVQSL